MKLGVRIVIAALGTVSAFLPGKVLATCPSSLALQTLSFPLPSPNAVFSSLDGATGALTPSARALLERAEGALSSPLLSVVQKAKPGPSGDPADYYSLAPYWWPNPGTDDGLPYVRRDGETNPERTSDRYDRVRLSQMVENVFDLALAAEITGEDRFARRAAEQIHTWFVDPATRMNPNLNHAQAIPGRNEGRAIGIIDSRVFAEVLDAATLLERSGNLPEETATGLRQWVGAYAAWLIQSPFGLEERAADNNHGTFYDAQLVHFLVYAGRCDLAGRVLEDTKLRAVGQIKPNGYQPLEAKRTRSLHYHAFNAEAFVRAAMIADRLGVDLYTYEIGASGSVQDTVRMLASYNGDFETWPHPRMDDNGEATVWRTLKRAQMLDPEDQNVARAIRAMDPDHEEDVLNLLSVQ